MFRILNQLKQWLNQANKIDDSQNKFIKSPSTNLKNEDIHSNLKPEKNDTLNIENKEINSNKQPEKTDSPINKPTYQSSDKSLQEQLNNLQKNGILSLWPSNGEYTGSIIINDSVVLDGRGATIWATRGPVLSIVADQVILRNLRIEVTGEMEIGNSENNCAILVKSGTSLNLEFENVEVRGSVMGLSEEEGEWQYPSTLNIGRIAHGREYNFWWRIIVPVDCKIASEISGIEFNKHNLNPGKNEINIHIEKLPQDTLINGNIYLVSANFNRRISVTAHIVSLPEKDILPLDNNVIWQAEFWTNFPDKAAQKKLNDIPEQKVVSNQPSQQEYSLPKPNYIDPEKNNAAVNTNKTYKEVMPTGILLTGREDTNDKKNKPSQIQSPDSPTTSPSINPIFQNSSKSKAECKNENIPPSSEEKNSSVINPIFQQNSPVTKPIKPEEVCEKDSSQKSDSPTNSQSQKRKQARPNNIFWGDGVNKEEPKE